MQIPPVTRIMVLTSIVLFLGSSLRFINAGLLPNYWPDTIYKLQIWRPCKLFFSSYFEKDMFSYWLHLSSNNLPSHHIPDALWLSDDMCNGYLCLWVQLTSPFMTFCSNSIQTWINIVYKYGRQLEEDKFNRATADYLFFIMFTTTVITVSIWTSVSNWPPFHDFNTML